MQGNVQVKEKLWRALWTGSRTTTGTFTIQDIFTTVPNATKLMFLAGNGGSNNGMVSTLVPLYILNEAGIRDRYIRPSTSDLLGGVGANKFNVVVNDGTSNSYMVVIRFNTNTQVNAITISGTGSTLYGIYVR